jgi:hypothetical protein
MNAIKCPICGTVYLGFTCPNKDKHKNDLPEDFSNVFGDIFK